MEKALRRDLVLFVYPRYGQMKNSQRIIRLFMKDSQIVALSTFVLFTGEAYGHYLIGKNEGKESLPFIS